MNWILLLGYIYLTYYSFSYARKVWREGNKLGGVSIALVSFCYLPISIWLYSR
jgi:hypothetical protein